MSKIARFTGNFLPFAFNASGTNRVVFGGAVQSDTLDANMNSDFFLGWEEGKDVKGFPLEQFFNAVTFTATQASAYLHQIGVPEWDSLQEYNTGSFSNVSGVIYKSLIDANIGNTPIGDLVNWIPLVPRNVMDSINGATGDGVTDDRAAFALADAAGDFVVPNGTYRIASNITIANTVTFSPGAIMSVDAGATVTFSGGVVISPGAVTFGGLGGVEFNGSIGAGTSQIFGSSITVSGTPDIVEISALWFETNTTPGTTVMSAAIQSCVDWSESSGVPFYIPSGRYATTASITVEAATNGRGAGVKGTIIEPAGAIYGFIWGAPSSSDRGGGLSDLAIKGTSSGLGGIRLGHLTIYTNQPVGFEFSDIEIYDFTSAAVTHPNRTNVPDVGVVITATGATGIFDSSSHGAKFNNVYCHDNYFGWFGVENNESTTHTFVNCSFRESLKYGFWAFAPTAYTFIGTIFESNRNSGIYLGSDNSLYEGSPRNITFINPFFENNNSVSGTYGMILDSAHAGSAPQGITFVGPVLGYLAGKKGLFVNKGREIVILNPRSGDTATAIITTTNSTSVRIIGGEDDAIYDLDSNTVHEAFDSSDGSFIRIDGDIKTRVGTGTGYIRPDGTLVSDGASSATTAVTSEEILKTYTIPADTIQSIGHGLHVKVSGSTAANANTKTIRLKMGGTTIFTASGAYDDDVWMIEGDIIYHGGDVFWCFTDGKVQAVAIDPAFTVIGSLDPTGSLDIEVTGQNGTASASDIVARQFQVKTINEW